MRFLAALPEGSRLLASSRRSKRLKNSPRILIAAPQVPFQPMPTGALARDLARELRGRGYAVEIQTIPFWWTPTESVLDHLVFAPSLDLAIQEAEKDLLIAVGFPACLVRHPRKIVWSATSTDHFPHGSGVTDSIALDACVRAERDALERTPMRFAVSATAAAWCREHHGLDTATVVPPIRSPERFEEGSLGDHLAVRAGGYPWPRVPLAIQALALTTEPVRLRVTGALSVSQRQQAVELARHLRVDDRVSWACDEEAVPAVLSTSRAVFLPARAEAFGTAAQEAAAAGKPILVCRDGGAPTEWLVEDETGYLVDPHPPSVAAAFDRAWRELDRGVVLGRQARYRWARASLGWSEVIDGLMGRGEPTGATAQAAVTP